MLELRVFIVEVLRKFDIEWASKNPQVDVKKYWIIELLGLDVRFKKVARDGVRDPEVSSEAENMS